MNQRTLYENVVIIGQNQSGVAGQLILEAWRATDPDVPVHERLAVVDEIVTGLTVILESAVERLTGHISDVAKGIVRDFEGDDQPTAEPAEAPAPARKFPPKTATDDPITQAQLGLLRRKMKFLEYTDEGAFLSDYKQRVAKLSDLTKREASAFIDVLPR